MSLGFKYLENIWNYLQQTVELGKLSVTQDTEIHDPLIFELLFGPFAYNSYQFFQVKIELRSENGSDFQEKAFLLGF